MYLDVYYSSDSFFVGTIQVRFYKFENNDDSTLVLSKRNFKTSFKDGSNKVRIIFNTLDTNTSYNVKFYEILRRTGFIPPGSYKVSVSVRKHDKLFQSVYLHDVDSMLSPSSPIRGDINKSLMPKSKSFLGIRLEKSAQKKATTAPAGKILENAKRRVDNSMRKRGFITEQSKRNGKNFIDLYYQDWFAGRYEVKSDQALSKQLTQENKLPGTSGINTDLGHPSLFSQYKRQNQEKKENNETKGEIGVTTNLGSGQQPYSGIDNNYFEVRGRLETYVSGIPVEMEGLYTSQDLNREIKSSYFKVHYDVDKMKEDLNKSVHSYNNKFSETKSKNVGMEQVYMSAIGNLERQRTTLQKELNKEIGNTNDTPLNSRSQSNLKKEVRAEVSDTAGISHLMNTDRDSADTANNSSNRPGLADSSAIKLSNKSAEEQASLTAKRKKLDELDKKIEKYKLLLVQNENTNHFDSLVGYNKLKSFDNQDEMTYRKMAKKCDALLPEGQAKGFIAGVTNFDAGMFPKEESKYTMGGQMMKGVDFGYDLGICKEGFTVGKTEYIGRDGTLDKYTCYSERTTLKSIKRQKLSLIYYGYTADRKMSGDAFFNNANISAPGFFQPVHIISTKYDGAISNYVTINGEAATSIKQSDNADVPRPTLGSKMAYHFNGDGNVPGTAIRLESSYDKIGLNFTNSTLPMSMGGTEQFRLAGNDEFFRHFLTAGAEYDVLTQKNFGSKGVSTKMGFDIKTNFKRYPNVAVSYKPFTTFRSVTDTFNIPQRPLFGSVWTAKASYQIKLHEKSLRFMILYNQNVTTMDSATYGCKMVQASTVYTDKIITASMSVGYTKTLGPDTTSIATAPNKMTFLNISGSYVLSKQLSLSGGQDYGLASFGFCKFAMNGGFTYRPAKKPFTVRLGMRYATYELGQGAAWQSLYSGSLDVLYRFKMKNAKESL